MRKRRKHRKIRRAAYNRRARKGAHRRVRHNRRRVRRNGQMHRVTGVATLISGDGGTVTVAYHSTKVVEFDDKKIVLRTGGWKTATTKARMNQASNQFNLGYSVYVDKGQWFVGYKGSAIPFTGDTLTLPR